MQHKEEKVPLYFTIFRKRSDNSIVARFLSSTMNKPIREEGCDAIDTVEYKADASNTIAALISAQEAHSQLMCKTLENLVAAAYAQGLANAEKLRLERLRWPRTHD